MITMQFSFSNPKAVPKSVFGMMKKETPEESSERKQRATGKIFIEPTKKCQVRDVVTDLADQGYILIEAFHQERYDPKKPLFPYHAVRFVFVHQDFFEENKSNKEFEGKKPEVLRDLAQMCEIALWSVRGFDNPFFQNDVEIKGQRAISINLEARTPLFHPDSTPVLVWEKDAQGNKIGDGPKPIKPTGALRFRF